MVELALLIRAPAAPRQRTNATSCGTMKVACEDGFEVVTKDKAELVAVTQWHVDHAHHKKVSEAEVMAMFKHP
jgi:hypothetical protein